MKVAVPADSSTVTSLMLICEKSLSMMLVVTLLLAASTCKTSKFPPLAPTIWIVKLSAPSTKLSLIVGIEKVEVVLPAGMVTWVTP